MLDRDIGQTVCRQTGLSRGAGYELQSTAEQETTAGGCEMEFEKVQKIIAEVLNVDPDEV